MRSRRSISSANKRKGSAVEQICANHLRAMGLWCVEPVHDSWLPIAWKTNNTAVCKKGAIKLPGDVRALGPGFAVMAEAKTSKGTLPYSRIKAHQHKTLVAWVEYGHMPIIFWHEQTTHSAFMVPYAAFDWKPRTSLTVDAAAELHCKTVDDLREYLHG